METDDHADIGDEYEEGGEWDEEYNEADADIEDAPEIKPELKKLYQQHPECNLDYIEQVIPKIPLQYLPPGGDKTDSNHRTYPFLTVFEKTKIIGLRANQLSKGSVAFIAVPKHMLLYSCSYNIDVEMGIFLNIYI